MAAGDASLVRRLAAGDQAAYAALYDQFGERLFRTALRLVGQAHDAEDVVQEVFAGLVRSRDNLAAVDDLAAYLFAALWNAAGKIAVRGRKLPTTGLAVEALGRQEEQRLDAQVASDLEAALGALPAAQREVVLLKVEGDLTFAEIGRVLGISANTAASRYRYALEKLRESLEVKQ
jgi:RNA polymerase sigma-70 factor (ECF subfamily)